MPRHLSDERAVWQRWAAAHGVDETAPSVDDVLNFYFDVVPPMTMADRQTILTNIRTHYGGAFNEVKPLPYPLLTRYVGVSLNEIIDAAKALPPREKAWILLLAVCRLSPDAIKAWTGDPGPIRGIVRLPKRSVPVPYWVWDAVRVSSPRRPKEWPWTPTDMHVALAAATAHLPEITRVAVWGRWSAMRVVRSTRRLSYFGRPFPVTDT